MLRQYVQDFQHQKSLLSQGYTKISDAQYSYKMHSGRKVIDQQLYDQAAKDGFPAGFFRDSFFHRVTLYCLPDGQYCSNSVFDLCTFAVCRINGYVDFSHCSFCGGEFHSLNVFAHPTNVNMDNRLVVLDLYEMGEQLRPTALVVTLEAIQNRVMKNRKRGKFTWVFIDECYLYFKYHCSGEFLYRAWKCFRKYAGIMTAATQNVEECLKSETAWLMLANSLTGVRFSHTTGT